MKKLITLCLIVAAAFTVKAQDKSSGDATFMSYKYFKYYPIGLTLEEAKIQYPDFFNRFSTNKINNQPTYDAAYSSKNDNISLNLYGKNGKIVGCSGTVQSSRDDDSSFSKGNKAIAALIDELKAKFKFDPKEIPINYNQNGIKFDAEEYVWEKNGKSLIIVYTKNYYSNGYSTEIELTQFDN